MNAHVNSTPSCPTCGRPLPAGAPAGLCPACLLVQAEETDPAQPSLRHRFEPPPLEQVAGLFPQLELLGLLGAGGMGAVYKARQRSLDRLVALKILPRSDGNGKSFEERFNREARALARLNHPHIVAVHEFGQAGDLHFFIMEFVDGANLRQLEQAGRLSPREALQIIPQICDALQYAHDEGVVHRDIKPENVLVDRKGRVKIADFGLAKILGVDPGPARLTAEGQVMGTPHYMAPEQVERPLSVDHRADIYSLGVVFYEMLTGDLPLGKFAPPSRKVEVDVRLDEVVLRALENDPARRYQQASEVRSQVETIAGSPAPAGSKAAGTAGAASITTPSRCVRWCGFPLVVERDGMRRLNGKELFKVWAIAFGWLTLGFGLVHAVTGETQFGWLGLSGGASALLRLSASTVVVVWGTASAWMRPWDGPLSQDTEGRVMLPRVPWWARGRALLAGLAVVVVAWLVFQQIPYWEGRGVEQRAPVPAGHPAAAEGEHAGTPGGTFEDGGLELLALREANEDSAGWWRPDGQPVVNARLEIRDGPVSRSPVGRNLDLAFRLGDTNGSSLPSLFEFEPDTGALFGGTLVQDGAEVAGGWPIRVAFSPSARTATFRFGYGRDPWRPIRLQLSDGRRQEPGAVPGDPDWKAEIRQARDVDGRLWVSVDLSPEAHTFRGLGTDTFLTVVPGQSARAWRMRLVVEDREGKSYLPQNARTGAPGEEFTPWDFEIPELRADRVGLVRLEVQPVRWVEFRDVLLHPEGRGGATTGSRTGTGGVTP